MTAHIDVTPDIDYIRELFTREWRIADERLRSVRRDLDALDATEEGEMTDREYAEAQAYLHEVEGLAACRAADAARMVLVCLGIDPAD